MALVSLPAKAWRLARRAEITFFFMARMAFGAAAFMARRFMAAFFIARMAFGAAAFMARFMAAFFIA